MHEVKPVTSGRRLVLTYNLIQSATIPEKLTPATNMTVAELERILPAWHQAIEAQEMPTSFSHLLEHQYTDTSLCFDGLKGTDKQIVSHLRQLCDQNGFYIYLASLVRERSGGCDEESDDYYGSGNGGYHDIDEEIDDNIKLTRVVDLDGTELIRDVKFGLEMFIEKDPFRGVEPDDEDYSGYTGNEGVSTTHFYRKTVRSYRLFKISTDTPRYCGSWARTAGSMHSFPWRWKDPIITGVTPRIEAKV